MHLLPQTLFLNGSVFSSVFDSLVTVCMACKACQRPCSMLSDTGTCNAEVAVALQEELGACWVACQRSRCPNCHAI